jgi:CRISPR-associated RAMP protein (TIGR02581 family)
MAMWDTFESRLVITARLVAASAVRVGAGGDQSALPSASNLPVLVGPDDRPFIPGSSLRGVVRSQVERIVRALEDTHGHGRGACNPVVKDEWCVKKDRMDELRDAARDDDRALANSVWDESCRVCRAFGNPWLASRIRIGDLPLCEAAGPLIEPRDGVAINRDKETVENKYDFEVVPRFAAFDLHITGENLDGAERGLLWLGLCELNAGHVLLGGFKGRGLGQVRMEEIHFWGVDRKDREALRRYLLRSRLDETPLVQAEDWLEALWKDMDHAEASDARTAVQ